MDWSARNEQHLLEQKLDFRCVGPARALHVSLLYDSVGHPVRVQRSSRRCAEMNHLVIKSSRVKLSLSPYSTRVSQKSSICCTRTTQRSALTAQFTQLTLRWLLFSGRLRCLSSNAWATGPKVIIEMDCVKQCEKGGNSAATGSQCDQWL